jgi:Peptidase family M23
MTNLGLKHGIAFFSLMITASWLALAHTSSAIPVGPKELPPVLILPVKCEIGRTCLIQKLVDHDASEGRRDYRCGTLTTDGHDGVDIRLRTMDDMQSGYAVVAVAAGRVLRVRDGEPDISSRQRTDLGGKDAGNGIVIDHGDGWETQYSHLRSGSVTVKPGQQVVTGQSLGLVGMSGFTEFPHLHFSVRHRGKVIDPFTGTGQGSDCSAAASPTALWAAEASRGLGYMPTAIIAAGLASAVPSRSVADRVSGQQLAGAKAPVLMWVDVIGAKTGDVQQFTITGPNGETVHSQQNVVSGGGLSWFAYSGKRAPAAGWPTGIYTGRYITRRDGVIVAEIETKSKMRQIAAF